MLIAAHSISAATLGQAVGNPILAFFLGIILHYILDFVPHYDTTDEGKFTARQILFITVDAAFGLAAMLYLNANRDLNSGFYCGALGGIFPDLLDNVPFWKDSIHKIKIFKNFYRFHQKVHFLVARPVYGILVQIIVVCCSLYCFITYL